MKNTYKSKKYKIIFTIAVILVILFLELLIVKSGFMWKTIKREYVNFENVNLCTVEKIEQVIIPKYNYVNSVSLFLVNITEETSGDIILKLINEDGKEIFCNSFPVSSIEVGRYAEFQINKFVIPDKKYILCIDYSGEVPEFGAPKIFITNKGNLQETGKCISNGNSMEENIAMCYSYSQFPYSVGLVTALVLVFLAVIFLV